MFSVHALWNLFEKYEIGLALAMIILGVFLMIFGGRYFKTTIILSTAFVLGTAVLLVLYVFIMPAATPEWTVWLSLFVIYGIGGGIGLIVSYFARFGVLFVGAFMGTVVGLIFYNMFIYRISDFNPLLMLWLTLMIFGVLVSILSF
jgi:hypothetical protein